MEFSSVVDAVTFAIGMQTALAERDAGLPKDKRLGSGPINGIPILVEM
jgi:hypothetical protein